MAPSVNFYLDMSADIISASPSSNSAVKSPRTLLLAPPSIASHPSALASVADGYDRSTTDIQMLDRLALGLVSLPSATYDLVLLLTDVDGQRTESKSVVNRKLLSLVYESLRPGAKLRSQDGSYPSIREGEQTEAILAGLVPVPGSGNGVMKPDTSGPQCIPIRQRKKKTEEVNTNAIPESNGVGFVDGLDYVDNDDDLIDDDELLTEEDLARPIFRRM